VGLRLSQALRKIAPTMRRSAPRYALAAALALGGCGHSDAAFVPQTQAQAAAPAKADAKPVAPPAQDAGVALRAPADARKPFVVIRFDGTEPHYAEALYDALQGALARKPDAAFELVAVTRDTDAAQRNLAEVLRSVTEMGMPAERLSLAAVAAADDATDEVWVYVR
jgi:hypothetical protein